MTSDDKSKSILARYAAGERIFSHMDRSDGVYDFSHADLRGAVFSSSSMFANFIAADLRDADFSNCNLKTCDFSGANLENASFRGSAIDAAVFDGADLTGCDFKDASTFGHVFVEDELPPH